MPPEAVAGGRPITRGRLKNVSSSGNLGVIEVLDEGLAAFKVKNSVTPNDNLETVIIRDVARWATISAMIASALWTRLEFIALLYA
jgi:hypothetical protein